jgi:DNA primase
MISPKSIDNVMSTLRIEEVIDDFVTLKRKGANYQGVCPFHDEKTPSFYVSPARGIYKCFGCGKGGNTVNFVMDHEQMSYIEAIKYIANRYRIELEETEVSQEEKEARELSESLYILNDFAMKHYQKNLLETDEGRSIGLSYFKERGFIEQTIKTFGLGYSSEEKDNLTRAALRKQFKLEHLKLLRLTNDYDTDFFRSRVMFAIHNMSGKVVGFTGRILDNDKSKSKYVNSPESEIYIKHKVLYGLYQGKNAIKKEDECILVEGNTDVITLHQGGVQNVVATSGTALNKDQIKLIKRFTNNIKLIYDGDPAGIKAALRGLDMILEEDMNIRLVLLPKNEDPDSFFKSKGIDGFKEFLSENEKDFILFKADYLLQFVGNDPIKRVEVFKDIIASIAKVSDHMKRLTYINICSNLMKMEEKVLVSEVSKIMDEDQKEKYKEKQRIQLQEARKQSLDQGIPLPEGIPDEDGVITVNLTPQTNHFISGDEYQERDIARILIAGGDKIYDEQRKITIAQYVVSNIEDSIDLIEHELYKKIISISVNHVHKNQVLTDSIFINHEDPVISQLAIDLIYTPYVYANWEDRNVFLQTQKMPDENFHRDAYQAIMRFKLKKISKQIKETTAILESSTDLDDNSKRIELKVLSTMIKERNEIAKLLNMVVLS